METVGIRLESVPNVLVQGNSFHQSLQVDYTTVLASVFFTFLLVAFVVFVSTLIVKAAWMLFRPYIFQEYYLVQNGLEHQIWIRYKNGDDICAYSSANKDDTMSVYGELTKK